MNYHWNQYLIEFLGTLFFAYTIFLTGNYLAIGAALSIAILLGGGMYNPAIAIAKFYNGDLSSTDLVPYIVSQILGALVAVTILKNQS